MRIIDGFRLRDVMGQATVIGEGVGQVNFNRLITLNETAAFLWRSVEGRDFDAELARKDADAIASQWREVGLVQ